jgi:fatty-acid desaturase
MQNVFAFTQPQHKINWKNVAIILTFHLAALPVLWTFSWQNLVALLIGNWIVGSLGVGLGWHRLLTHQSFKTSKWIEYALSILATMSIQDSPNKWIATHRIHHAFTDTDKDPHSIRSGFWWAQIGWIVWGTAQDHDQKTLQRYVPDLLKDRGHALISRFYVVPIVISAVILFAIGGWTVVIWGVFARVVFGWHTTWFVNSLSHIYGSRPHETGDESTNNWFVALLTFGEGWHNNHHMYPTSARHGLGRFQFDMNWIAIRVLEYVGWARNVRLPNVDPKQIELKQAA